MLRNSLFLEAQADFLWHEGMLIEGSDIQNNPLRDLVTPRNPQSRYGFLSYLKAKDRLFDYLNLASHYPPRSDFAGYVKWVAEHFQANVRLNTRVKSINYCASDRLIEIRTDSSTSNLILAKSIVFGTGRSELIPDQFKDLMSDDVVHLKDYLPAKQRWCARHGRPRICVLGGSQSAIEIVLDLSSCADVTSISRSFGFKQKDLSAFTENIYFPEFVDYFHSAGTKAQNNMMQELWRSNYGAADPDVIASLNFKLYEQKVKGHSALRVLGNTMVDNVRQLADADGFVLQLKEKFTGQTSEINVDGIVLATGYKNFGDQVGQEPFHPLLANVVAGQAKFRSDGGIEIGRDYRIQYAVEKARPAIYLNGLCEASHGFGDAGSFSLLSIRSDEIARSVMAFLQQYNSVEIKEPAYAK